MQTHWFQVPEKRQQLGKHWVIQKGESLNNIGAGVGGAGICWNFLVMEALVGTIFKKCSFHLAGLVLESDISVILNQLS